MALSKISGLSREGGLTSKFLCRRRRANSLHTMNKNSNRACQNPRSGFQLYTDSENAESPKFGRAFAQCEFIAGFSHRASRWWQRLCSASRRYCAHRTAIRIFRVSGRMPPSRQLELAAGVCRGGNVERCGGKGFLRTRTTSQTLASDVGSNFNRATGGSGVGAYNNLC